LIYYICEEHGEEENVEKRVLKKEKDLGKGEGGLVPYPHGTTHFSLTPYTIR